MKSSFDALSGIGSSFWQQRCKEDATTYRINVFAVLSMSNVFFLFSDKMGLFQTLWKSKVILTKQDWNDWELKLLKKILNKFVPSELQRETFLHSRSKCLVWVKKCCHIWFDQNFDPSLLTKKLWPFYMRMKQIFFFFFEKKISKLPTEKKLIFQNRQRSQINPWVSRIE